MSRMLRVCPLFNSAQHASSQKLDISKLQTICTRDYNYMIDEDYPGQTKTQQPSS